MHNNYLPTSSPTPSPPPSTQHNCTHGVWAEVVVAAAVVQGLFAVAAFADVESGAVVVLVIVVGGGVGGGPGPSVADVVGVVGEVVFLAGLSPGALQHTP